jgi:hypothetical protein
MNYLFKLDTLGNWAKLTLTEGFQTSQILQLFKRYERIPIIDLDSRLIDQNATNKPNNFDILIVRICQHRIILDCS